MQAREQSKADAAREGLEETIKDRAAAERQHDSRLAADDAADVEARKVAEAEMAAIVKATEADARSHQAYISLRHASAADQSASAWSEAAADHECMTRFQEAVLRDRKFAEEEARKEAAAEMARLVRENELASERQAAWMHERALQSGAYSHEVINRAVQEAAASNKAILGVVVPRAAYLRSAAEESIAATLSEHAAAQRQHEAMLVARDAYLLSCAKQSEEVIASIVRRDQIAAREQHEYMNRRQADIVAVTLSVVDQQLKREAEEAAEARRLVYGVGGGGGFTVLQPSAPVAYEEPEPQPQQTRQQPVRSNSGPTPYGGRWEAGGQY